MDENPYKPTLLPGEEPDASGPSWWLTRRFGLTRVEWIVVAVIAFILASLFQPVAQRPHVVWQFVTWPLWQLSDGPISDRLAGALIAIIVLGGLLAPLLVRHRVAWIISAISASAWLLIGWWFAYMAAV